MPEKEKKTKSIVTKKQKRELIFAGSNSLTGVDPKSLKPSELAAHKARILVARALGIPPNTVVIMGNVPYVDNHGRKAKLEDYAKGAQFEYDYVQIATDDNMKAIVKCRIVEVQESKNPDTIVPQPIVRPLCGWVIGECSPVTTRMSTLKGYQNHLAQTRAENRAFEAAFGTKFRNDLYAGIAKQLGVEPGTDVADQPEVELALQAGNTSAEEAVELQKTKPSQQSAINFDPFKNAQLAINKAVGVKDLEALRQRVKGSPNFKPEQVNRLLGMIDDRIAQISLGS